MREIVSGQFFTLAYWLLRCFLVVMVVRPIDHTIAYNVTSVSPILGMGSNPVWIDDEQAMYVLDSDPDQYKINCYKADSNQFTSANIDTMDGEYLLQILVPVAGAKGSFVISFSDKLKMLVWDGKNATSLKASSELPLNKTKEEYVSCAKGDSRQRLWVGVGKERDLDDPIGKLYMIDGSGATVEKVRTIFAPDAIAWSPESTRIYWINIKKQMIYSRPFDIDSGDISSNGAEIFDYGAKKFPGFPSDMTMDSSGNLWVACMNTPNILKIDTKGSSVEEFKIPEAATSITAVAFGGKNLEDLYVTGNVTHLFRVTDTGSTGLVTNAIKLPTQGP